jgi:iron-sulfur cluster insertion protein
MYQYSLVEEINMDDFVLENMDDFVLESHGIKVAIDPLLQQFLEGCRVEFIQELGSNFFQITNPNASAECGCRNSFAV